MFYCVWLSSLWMIITDATFFICFFNSLFESALFFCLCCSFYLQTTLCCCLSSFYALLKYFCLTRTQKRRRGGSIIIIFHFIMKRFAKRRTALCAIFSWGGAGERLRLRSLPLDLRWPSGHLCACWRTGLWDRSVLIPPSFTSNYLLNWFNESPPTSSLLPIRPTSPPLEPLGLHPAGSQDGFYSGRRGKVGGKGRKGIKLCGTPHRLVLHFFAPSSFIHPTPPSPMFTLHMCSCARHELYCCGVLAVLIYAFPLGYPERKNIKMRPHHPPFTLSPSPIH